MRVIKYYTTEDICKNVTIHDSNTCKNMYVGDIPCYMLPDVFTEEHSNLIIEESVRG